MEISVPSVDLKFICCRVQVVKIEGLRVLKKCLIGVRMSSVHGSLTKLVHNNVIVHLLYNIILHAYVDGFMVLCWHKVKGKYEKIWELYYIAGSKLV
jgi:hypothetical protein